MTESSVVKAIRVTRRHRCTAACQFYEFRPFPASLYIASAHLHDDSQLT